MTNSPENENLPELNFTEIPFQRNNAPNEKKRAKLEENGETDDDIHFADDNKLEEKIIRFYQKISGRNKHSRLIGAQGIRHLLCSESVPPIGECIKIGIIPWCVAIFQKVGLHDLKYEAAWILTNISAGTSEQTSKVVEMGAIAPLIELLSSDRLNLVAQSCWVLTNCMGNDTQTRDDVFSRGIVSLLGDIIRIYKSEKELMRIVSWCFSTAFQGKRSPIYDNNILKAIPLLTSLIKMEDAETVVCAFWALSSIIFIGDSDSEEDSSLLEEIYKAIEERGILPRLIDNIKSENMALVYPCLRAIGNIVSGPDQQTEKIVQLGVLAPLCDALRTVKTNIVKEAAWVLSNISAGNLKQIKAVVDSGAVNLLLNVIYKSEFRAKKEAIWAIANITNGGDESHILKLFKFGAIKCLCYSLNVPDWNTILVVFEALENMLNGARSISPENERRFRTQFEESGGFDKVFDLQHHENVSVHQKAFNFIQQFY